MVDASAFIRYAKGGSRSPARLLHRTAIFLDQCLSQQCACCSRSTYCVSRIDNSWILWVQCHRFAHCNCSAGKISNRTSKTPWFCGYSRRALFTDNEPCLGKNIDIATVVNCTRARPASCLPRFEGAGTDRRSVCGHSRNWCCGRPQGK